MKIKQYIAWLLLSFAFCTALIGAGEFSENDFVPTKELLEKLREMPETERNFIEEAKRLTLKMYLAAIEEYEKYNETSQDLKEISNIVDKGKQGTHSDKKFGEFKVLLYTEIKSINRKAYDIIGDAMASSQKNFIVIKTKEGANTRDVLVLMKNELANLDKAILTVYKKSE